MLRGHLELVLLSVLVDGELYGLEIAQRARARTDGYFDFSVGSLYPALHRMARDGLVVASEATSPSSGGTVRRYRLTAKGRRALVEQRAEFRRFADAVLGLAKEATA